jgi:hypothetical protein
MPPRSLLRRDKDVTPPVNTHRCHTNTRDRGLGATKPNKTPSIVAINLREAKCIFENVDESRNAK